MSFVLQPWQFHFLILVGWVQREQQKIILFYQAELEALMKAQGKKRLLLTDDQRRLLAVKGKSLGRKVLMGLTTIVTPDTILRWHRTLVAQKWNYSDRRKSVGRPRVEKEIVDLVLQFARENLTWGYDRIQGALSNLGHMISDQTVGNILKEHGIEPAPERKRQTTWKTFIKAHWDVLAAIDFTTVEVWTKGGLVTYYLLFVMELSTRRVHLAACTSSLGDEFMRRIARNLTDPFDGFLTGKRYVLMDRDTNFSSAFRSALEDAGVKSVRLPPKSPNLNAHLERFHLSVKSECLSRRVFFGEKMLRHAVREFLAHYHEERNHQSLGNPNHRTRGGAVHCVLNLPVIPFSVSGYANHGGLASGGHIRPDRYGDDQCCDKSRSWDGHAFLQLSHEIGIMCGPCHLGDRILGRGYPLPSTDHNI